MIKVNIVPVEILAKAKQRLLIFQASAIGVLLAVVLVIASLSHFFSLRSVQNEFSFKKSKLNNLSAIVAQVEEAEKAAMALRSRLAVIEDLLKGRSFYPIFMSEFARTVPAGVRVTNMTTAEQPGYTVKLTITAVATTNDDVAGWVRTLQSLPHFGGVELGPVSYSNKTRNFNINASYTNKL